MQEIVAGRGCVAKLQEYLAKGKYEKMMLVCDSSFPYLSIRDEISKFAVDAVRFDGFTPNPKYEDVINGVRLFQEAHCDVIIAVGGGSTIDVAKCIKLYCKMNVAENCLQGVYSDSGVPLVAIPTTAGTGSESTRFAVIYYQGVKQSVAHDSIVPNCVFLDPTVLATLPVYQKKCTMLDALCQGIESYWSVNSTDESRGYAKQAIATITKHYRAYIFENDSAAAEQIMQASNNAGRAINITQTTAAHAMSYKLTSLYRLPHGHAVAVCLPRVWRYMIGHLQSCIDQRGAEYLAKIFEEIAEVMSCKDVEAAIAFFEKILDELEIADPVTKDERDRTTLASSVNVTRLSNNPVKLDDRALYSLYCEIVKTENDAL